MMKHEFAEAVISAMSAWPDDVPLGEVKVWNGITYLKAARRLNTAEREQIRACGYIANSAGFWRKHA